MEKQLRVIIGDRGGLFSANCANEFKVCGCWTVLRPQTQDALLQTIRSEHPDILILEPSAMTMDVQSFAAAVRQMTDITLIAAILRPNPLLEHLMEANGFCCIRTEGNSTGFAEAVLRQYGSALQSMPQEMTAQGRKLEITKLLQHCGIAPNLSGFHCLRCAISTVCAEPSGKLVMKRVYRTVAQMMSSTPSRVERAMRHAILLAWEQSPTATAQIFGLHEPRHLANSEFIAMAVEMLRMDEMLRCSVG